MRAHDPGPDPSADARGPHTLRICSGTVVDVFGDDVFVELGPRMQGVLSVREFDERPAAGEEFEFTLRGQEEGLWILQLEETAPLTTWERMETGSLVRARIIRQAVGGLEAKVGPLHAFMPRSHTGLPRDGDLEDLVGRAFTCEVLEVDRERQRALLSRKLVVQRERESDRQRAVGSLTAGQVVHGRVSRVERYGAFVRFGAGLEGLVHVSNLAWERPEHARDVVTKGEAVSVKVLGVKASGKRIALGLKQMQPSPWQALQRELGEGAQGRILAGRVKRIVDFGAFVAVRAGVEGLLHRSECGLGVDEPVRARLAVEQRLSVRVVELDADRERLSLSLLHTNGARIAPEEADGAATLVDGDAPGIGTNVGARLRDALGGGDTKEGGATPSDAAP